VLTFRRVEAVSVTLPSTVDVPALARELKATSTGGRPPVRIPENLQELARGIVDARPDMPAWMKHRVHDLRTVPVGERDRDDVGYRLPNAFDTGDREAYLKVVEDLLCQPPGWFRGHSHLDYLMYRRPAHRRPGRRAPARSIQNRRSRGQDVVPHSDCQERQ
jgi:hypothetical protein